jgi:hypothetical protein
VEDGRSRRLGDREPRRGGPRVRGRVATTAFADARCDRGTRVVSRSGEPLRDLPSRILDHVMGDGTDHPIEYQIFFMNLRANPQARVTAFAAQ